MQHYAVGLRMRQERVKIFHGESEVDRPWMKIVPGFQVFPFADAEQFKARSRHVQPRHLTLLELPAFQELSAEDVDVEAQCSVQIRGLNGNMIDSDDFHRS
jgi:hypothetical protein